MADKRSIRRPGTSPPVLARCAVGDTLCHVCILSEAEWEAMPPEERPATAEHLPGLGWVVATPGRLRQDPDACSEKGLS